MPEYLAPGVFVEEVPSGNRPIEGVGTSTGAMIGRALKGPVNEPRLVTSFSQYLSVFGGFHMDYYLTYAAQQFFFQGGKRCYVVRAFKPSDDKAYSDVAQFELGKTTPATTDTSTADAEATTEGSTTARRRTRRAATGSVKPVLVVRANSPGKWGNNLRVKVEPPSFDPNDKDNTDEKFSIVLENFTEGKWDRIAVFDQLSFKEFVDDLPNLNYVERKINDTNPYIEVEITQEGEVNKLPEDWWKKEDGSDWFRLEGGDAGKTLKPVEYMGSPATKTKAATGLNAFNAVDDINIVAIPALNEPKTRALGGTRDATSQGVGYCTLREDCVFLIDPLPDLSPQQVRDYKQGVGAYSGNAFSSSYAAMYYPWIWINDPLTNKRIKFPPSGAAMGTYANTDVNRGVHKAPAGTEDGKVRVAADIVREVSKGEQEILNPIGINVIRKFPGAGIVVWGARTVSSDPEWRYINVRRLFLFLEKSIDKGTQTYVFEPNDTVLWNQIRANVGAFLRLQWMAGALVGNTPEEAFFVKCDEETNPPESVDAGRVITVIGVAPSKPAEFVIFRISQWRPSS